MTTKNFFLLIIIISLFVDLAYADNFGVRGSIYTIAEPDMLFGIHSKLLAMQKDGELNKIKKLVIKRSLSHILRPAPVIGVSDLKGDMKPHSHLYNPSILLSHDIRIGNHVFKAGTVVNPLNNVNIDEKLIFINADNIIQVQWVKRKISDYEKLGERFKIILVQGNINDSAKSFNHRVYFDQYGKLCRTFDIKHTPTLVYQPSYKGVFLPRMMVSEVSIA